MTGVLAVRIRPITGYARPHRPMAARPRSTPILCPPLVFSFGRQSGGVVILQRPCHQYGIMFTQDIPRGCRQISVTMALFPLQPRAFNRLDIAALGLPAMTTVMPVTRSSSTHARLTCELALDPDARSVSCASTCPSARKVRFSSSAEINRGLRHSIRSVIQRLSVQCMYATGKAPCVNAARCAPPARSWPQSGRAIAWLGRSSLSLRKARFAEFAGGVRARAPDLQAALSSKIHDHCDDHLTLQLNAQSRQ